MPQWSAVMKKGLASLAVLLSSEPEQKRAAAGGDDGVGALLVVVGIADRAHDVDVAGAGLLHVRLAEPAVVVVDEGEVQLSAPAPLPGS